MIFVSVGTFVYGFNELVAAADAAASSLALNGFAQIGNSRCIPRHLDWKRFLNQREMKSCLDRSSVVICHGGVGIIGDAMRAKKPVMVVPRRGSTSARNPANDQTEFSELMAARYGIAVCTDPGQLKAKLSKIINYVPKLVDYELNSNVSEILVEFLASS